MKSRNRWGAAAALVMIIALHAPAPATPALLMQHTFEEGAGGWTAFGQEGKVSITHEAANVKEGKAALH